MKDLSKNLRYCIVLLILWPIITTMTSGCLKHVSPSSGMGSPHGRVSAPSGDRSGSGVSSVLLLAQAQFEKGEGEENNSVPGSAKLTLVRKTKDGWKSSLLEDPESNVFHKALWFTPPEGAGDTGILTIAGNAARLKLWHSDAGNTDTEDTHAGDMEAGSMEAGDGKTTTGAMGTTGAMAKAGKWKGTALWSPSFGGEQNRLRDIEVGDVTGDGVLDLVIATHDQGIVAVLQWKAGVWEVTELDRTPETFVHEIEIADVNRDGRQEFFATPSAPNRLDGTPQPGRIVMYRFDEEHFIRSTVEEFPDRHVKEILAADVSGSGCPDLFAAIEGEMAMVLGQPTLLDTVKIKQYRFIGDKVSGDKASGDKALRDNVSGGQTSEGLSSGGTFSGKVIADLPDMLCRNLTAGDVDGDGSIDIVASTMQSGIFILRQKRAGEKKQPREKHQEEKHPEDQPKEQQEASATAGEWEKTLIDADSSGFEHATLIADLDHDGLCEIYVASDDQHVLRRYQWNGQTFQRDDLVPLQLDDITFCVTLCPSHP
ncbi:MAG: VCBS repeat-containing protein [bacterium]